MQARLARVRVRDGVQQRCCTGACEQGFDFQLQLCARATSPCSLVSRLRVLAQRKQTPCTTREVRLPVIK